MIEMVYNSIDNQSYPADQEIFGNLIEKHYPDRYSFVSNAPVYLDGVGNGQEVSVDFLKSYIEAVKQERPEVIACSHHTWI